MKNVYVVTQNWDNGESYDLHMYVSEVICVCNSLAESKAYIADVKAKIIEKALAITGTKFSEVAYEFVPDDGNRCVDEVWFNYEHNDSPFGGFNHDAFEWCIEEFEVIGS